MEKNRKNAALLVGELLLYCAFGCLCGAGVGFFLFLRLGFPNDPRLAGYVSGLFLMSGLKLGFAVWVIRRFALVLRRLWIDAGSFPDFYMYKDIDVTAYPHLGDATARR